MPVKAALALLFILYSLNGLAAPSWATGQTVKHITSKVVVVTCSGSGLARDLSFRSAVESCNAIAATEANSEFTSKSVVIETEAQAAKLYSEISSQKHVTGLTPKTEHESTAPSDNGFVAWIQARYDLSAATVTSINKVSDSSGQKQGRLTEVQPQDDVSPDIKSKVSAVSTERALTITMIPEKCSDYLIRGKLPRSHSCQTNPMQIMVNVADDTEIILRPASSAFLPKTIKVYQEREPASEYESEVLDVVFDRK